LPGVRFTDWPFGTIVDGPLWSLPCEVVLYLMVALLGSLRLLRLPVLLGLLAAGVACLWFDTANSPWFIGGVGWLLGFFAAGMIGYELRARSLFHPALALGAAVGILVTLQLGGFVLWFPLLGGYLTLYLAFSRTLPLLAAAAFGDLSYGMYIYGWPVEQTVLQRFGLLPWWQVFLLSLPLAAALAFLSWHIVEKPALRLKPRPRATLGPAQGDGEPA